MALEIAGVISKKFNKKCTIINADALQIYCGLPILSAQPNIVEQQEQEHFLYGIIEPWQNSSVANWLELATSIINNCFDCNKLPIVVGGSGMYISSLIDGISATPIISNEIRHLANKNFATELKEDFVEKMIKLGEAPENRQKLMSLDQQRLIRRYEILLASGKNLDYWQALPKQAPFASDDIQHFHLEIDRQTIYRRCNDRFLTMLAGGAIEEVRQLIDNSKQNQSDLISNPNNICKTIGYHEIACYLGLMATEKINKEQLITISTQKTRNYAKRQLTWFRHQNLNRKNITNYHELLQNIAIH